VGLLPILARERLLREGKIIAVVRAEKMLDRAW